MKKIGEGRAKYSFSHVFFRTDNTDNLAQLLVPPSYFSRPSRYPLPSVFQTSNLRSHLSSLNSPPPASALRYLHMLYVLSITRYSDAVVTAYVSLLGDSRAVDSGFDSRTIPCAHLNPSHPHQRAPRYQINRRRCELGVPRTCGRTMVQYYT